MPGLLSRLYTPADIFQRVPVSHPFFPKVLRAVVLLLGPRTPSSRFPCWKFQFNLSFSICQTLLPRIKLSFFDPYTFNGHHHYLRPSIKKCGCHICPQHTLRIRIQGLPAPGWLCLPQPTTNTPGSCRSLIPCRISVSDWVSLLSTLQILTGNMKFW